jgi:hypothetical protein
MPSDNEIPPEAAAVLAQYAGDGFTLSRTILGSADVALAVYKHKPDRYSVVSALKIQGKWVGSMDCFRGSADDAFLAVFGSLKRQRCDGHYLEHEKARQDFDGPGTT